jgi:Tfp pilus assembly protein PilV
MQLKNYLMKLKKDLAGFTVLEVILAIVILTIISTMLMGFLLSGDKLYSRNMLIVKAAQLARNEAELLKARSHSFEMIEDKEYEEEVGNRMFMIKRNVLDTVMLDSLFSGYPVEAVEIQIMEGADSEKPLTSFKLLQGYGVK